MHKATLIFYTSVVDVSNSRMIHTAFLKLDYEMDDTGRHELLLDGVLFDDERGGSSRGDASKRPLIIYHLPTVFRLGNRRPHAEGYDLRRATVRLRKAIFAAMGPYTLLYFDTLEQSHSFHYWGEERTDKRPLVQLDWRGRDLVPPEFLRQAA
jgi:hypothetical protein